MAWAKPKRWNLKREIESFFNSSKNNVISINYIKSKIDYTQQIIKFRLCGSRDEMIIHIIRKCNKLPQNEYKSRHDWVWKGFHWELYKKLRFDHADKLYMHKKDLI